MSSNAKHEGEYIPLKGQEVFRVQRFVLVIGLIGLMASIGVGIVTINNSSQLFTNLFLVLFFALLGIPIIVSSIVIRLYVDTEGIEHRNGLGIRKRINWRDVKAVIYTATTNIIIIYTEREKIKLEPVYRDYDRLAELVIQACPDAYNRRDLTKVMSLGVRTKGEITIFRRRRLYGFFSIILLMVAIGFQLTPATQSHVIMFLYGVPGLFMFLSFAIARTYTDNEKIVYKNLIGLKKQIRWEDVRSVENVTRSGLIIKGCNKKIKVSWGFAGYELLCDIVSERRLENQRMHRMPD